MTITRRQSLISLSATPLLAQNPGRVVVRIDTELGEIEVALHGDRAPKTVENFLRYVDGGFYNGGLFHRSVTMANQPQSPIKIEVIQGGPNPEKKPGFDPIPLERTSLTGLKHVNGTISMARSGPDTATADFFFCINDQPSLDYGGLRNPDAQGFAAFGLVLKGLDVIRKIQQRPVEAQRLTPPIKIRSITRL